MLRVIILCLLLSVCCGLSSNVSLEILSIWHTFPSVFTLNATILQPQCKQSIENLINRANSGDVEALKMFDATAKIPSGILNGNVQQYGDFDQCLSIPEAQYCLAEIDIESIWQTYNKYSHLEDQVHSYYFIRDNFDNPPHRVPGFKLLKWGFCIPQQCSEIDLVNVLQSNFKILANIRPGLCQKSNQPIENSSFGHLFTKILLIFLFLIVVLSTFIHYAATQNRMKINSILYTIFVLNPNPNNSVSLKLKDRIFNQTIRIFMGFSLLENWRKFIEIKEDDPNEIACLHGIRSLSAFALLMAHKCLVLFFNPYMNRTYTIDRLTKPYSIIIKNAIVYTDLFLLISGLLNARGLLNDLKKTNRMRIGNKLITRLFRILPNLIVVILFCTYILPNLGSGPLWPIVIQSHSDLCKKYMWRNMLFVHNYYGFEHMCLTHTHQLGIDMQLFLVTPFLVSLVAKSKTLAKYVIISLALASSLLRFIVTYYHSLFTVVYFGVDVSAMFKTADLSYILPTHRATIYLIGVNLAVSLHFSKSRPNWTKLKEVFLWLTVIWPFILGWLGPYHMGLKEYVYNKTEASIIAALTPIGFGFSVATAILVFHKNMAWFLGYFFNWKYWQYGTKISYALYLVQFPVYFYNVGLTKHVDEYLPSFQFSIAEVSLIIFLSILLTVCIEMPFMNIKRILFDDIQRSKMANFNSTSRRAKSG